MHVSTMPCMNAACDEVQQPGSHLFGCSNFFLGLITARMAISRSFVDSVITQLYRYVCTMLSAVK